MNINTAARKYLKMWDHETKVHVTQGTAEAIQRWANNVQSTICAHIKYCIRTTAEINTLHHNSSAVNTARTKITAISTSHKPGKKCYITKVGRRLGESVRFRNEIKSLFTQVCTSDPLPDLGKDPETEMGKTKKFFVLPLNYIC